MAEPAALLVLVTGASGFVSTWLIKELLEKGEYRVRGTVRNKSNKEKVQPLLDLVPDAKYPLELVEADLTEASCWGPAVEGCTYVFHVASPFPPLSSVVSEESVVGPAVRGMTNVLTACSESCTVKRVVFTCSTTAILSGYVGTTEGYEYTEEDWAEESRCFPYPKSKLKSERAAWEFVKKLQSDKAFELVVVHPGLILGPILSRGHAAGSIDMIKPLLNRDIPGVINTEIGMVDVRDVAAAEIAAMFTPSAAGKRFILVGECVRVPAVARIIYDEFQPQGYNPTTFCVPTFVAWGLSFFDPVVKATYCGVNITSKLNNDRMQHELGVTPRPMAKAILDTCYSIIELGFVEKKPGYLGPPELRNSSTH